MTHPVFSFLAFFDGAEKIVVFLLMLSVLVVFHEFGHFAIARWNGVRVNDFAIGFGPTLVKWTSPRSGTNYRVNAVWLGGYCAMQGEDGRSNENEQQRDFRDRRIYEPDNFQAKSPWRRLAIIVAGPIANFVIALAIFFLAAVIVGIPGDAPTTQVAYVEAGMPAQRAGIVPGDRILALDGIALRDGHQMLTTIWGAVGKRVRVTYQHDRSIRTVVIPTLPHKNPSGRTVAVIGFVPVSLAVRVGPGAAGVEAWRRFVETMTTSVSGIGQLVLHPLQMGRAVQGPIGIARISATVQQFGWGPYAALAATISISLGIFNLLPIPALDGGRAAFVLVELIRGKPVDPKKEALVHVGGFAVLLMLLLAVSYHDVSQLITGQAIF